jgi:hypothetical protein
LLIEAGMNAPTVKEIVGGKTFKADQASSEAINKVIEDTGWFVYIAWVPNLTEWKPCTD